MNFKLLQTLSSYLAKLVPESTEVILTIESDGISVATFIAAESRLPLVICKPFHYEQDMCSFTQKTGYYERTMYLPTSIRGKKITIVDCMVSTGGTIDRMIEAAESLGEGTEVVSVLCLNNKDNYSEPRTQFSGKPYAYLFDTRITDEKSVSCSLSSTGKRVLWNRIDETIYALTEQVAHYSNQSTLGYMVGALILDSDSLEIVAWGSRRGDLHAEQDALMMMKQNCPDWESRRFTLYSTLEPCTHRNNHGHTPCATLIADTPQIHWVVMGHLDVKDKEINGAGSKLLSDAGKSVRLIHTDKLYATHM